MAHLALAQLEQRLFALARPLAFEHQPAAEHDPPAAALDLDDLQAQDLVNIGVQVARAAQADVGSGHEALAERPQVDQQATLDRLDDARLDDLFLVLALGQLLPGRLEVRLALAEDDVFTIRVDDHNP